jgi:hypothetical protein
MSDINNIADFLSWSTIKINNFYAQIIGQNISYLLIYSAGGLVDGPLVNRPAGRLCQLVDRAKRRQLVDTNLSTGSTRRQLLIYYVSGQLVDSANSPTAYLKLA